MAAGVATKIRTRKRIAAEVAIRKKIKTGVEAEIATEIGIKSAAVAGRSAVEAAIEIATATVATGTEIAIVTVIAIVTEIARRNAAEIEIVIGEGLARIGPSRQSRCRHGRRWRSQIRRQQLTKESRGKGPSGMTMAVAQKMCLIG